MSVRELVVLAVVAPFTTRCEGGGDIDLVDGDVLVLSHRAYMQWFWLAIQKKNGAATVTRDVWLCDKHRMECTREFEVR